MYFCTTEITVNPSTMKFLAVFLLLGVALATAVPLQSHDRSLGQDVNEIDYLIQYAGKGDSILDLVGDRLSNLFDTLTQKLRDALEHGREIQSHLLIRVHDLYKRMRDLGVEVSEETKKLFRDILDKAEEYWRKQLDRITSMEDNLKEDVSEAGKELREKMDRLTQRLKDALEHGKEVRDDFLQEIKNVYEKMREVGTGLGQKARNHLKEIRENLKEYWQKQLDRFAHKDAAKSEGGIFGQKLKKVFEDLVQKMKKAFDEGKGVSEDLMKKAEDVYQKLSNLGVEVSDKVKSIFEDLQSKLNRNAAELRSVKETFQKIKNYFKDLNIELKEKFTKFGEWVKNQYQKVLEKGKSKVENIKKIASEFVKDVRKISKDVAEEALEFFREHKEDLGLIYDHVKEKVREIISQ